MTTLQWVSIVDDTGRTSSLEVGGNVVRVVGNLPHNTEIVPKSESDARRLVAWLEQWIVREELHRCHVDDEGEK